MTNRLARRFIKPEYFFRPVQLLRRAVGTLSASIPSQVVVKLPWGCLLQIAPNETIGGGIWRLGVHELAVSESLWRLIDPGETVMDVGANIGYFTCLMAVKTGRKGLVLAFEPHPGMRQRLNQNAILWQGIIESSQIRLFPYALSESDAEASLILPQNFDVNSGTAYMGDTLSPHEAGTAIQVQSRRLDTLINPGPAPAVVKIDVEGHETQVLAGMGQYLTSGDIRDIVFEDHRAYPSTTMLMLEESGYTLYSLRKGLLRPLLLPPDAQSEQQSWEAPNYLATLNPARAEKRLRALGWFCLRRSV